MIYKGFRVEQDRGSWDIIRTDITKGGLVASTDTRKSAKSRIDRFHDGEAFTSKYVNFSREEIKWSEDYSSQLQT